MTNTPDLTAPEAVERPIRFRPVVSADGLAAARMDRSGNYVMYTDYVAERDALRAELAEAKMLLSHMVNHAEWREKNEGVFWEATDKARAFLARHQKGQTND